MEMNFLWRATHAHIEWRPFVFILRAFLVSYAERGICVEANVKWPNATCIHSKHIRGRQAAIYVFDCERVRKIWSDYHIFCSRLMKCECVNFCRNWAFVYCLCIYCSQWNILSIFLFHALEGAWDSSNKIKWLFVGWSDGWKSIPSGPGVEHMYEWNWKTIADKVKHFWRPQFWRPHFWEKERNDCAWCWH